MSFRTVPRVSVTVSKRPPFRQFRAVETAELPVTVAVQGPVQGSSKEDIQGLGGGGVFPLLDQRVGGPDPPTCAYIEACAGAGLTVTSIPTSLYPQSHLSVLTSVQGPLLVGMTILSGDRPTVQLGETRHCLRLK